MRSLGLCIGASTLSTVELVQDGNGTRSVVRASAEPHNGNPQKHVLETLEKIERTSYRGIAVTGRKFRKYVNLTSIPEPEAVEEALAWLYGNENDLNAVVSAGGETFLVYVLGRDGKITAVRTGNKCASGTGEFFLQQIRRIGISLDDAVTYARTEPPYRVSGRCSVFCKSDCTHATNKGIPKGRVAAGLSQMMAGKIFELLTHVPRENIVLIGGCAQNTVMVDYLKREIGNLIVPREAPVFEALGCALWALKNETRSLPGRRDLFNHGGNFFSRLAPLKNFEPMVTYKTTEKGAARAGDCCVLGLDVGSTTTKAVIVRLDDNAVCSSVYIRTDGDPVRAARKCYADLHDQLGPLSDRISIVGLGVTGSGRQIAGLHAMTDGVVNEIIAHATGALFFDRDVDTIFEIGGQDAKYTYITNGVPSDYAMNDACSAGTGSFLEEAARESLAIEMEDIAEIALQGRHPPNFNDQCAAFISSDIKKAFHDGIDGNDVVAGLVYAVCMNYSRRVRGNRPAGKKIFMQGGVCYNRAVPLAMAALTGKPIIVPPDPGLIGAFGVALEVMGRMKLGLLEEGAFSLARLKDREISHGAPFTCDGGRERCDRKCTIARIRIEGKTYPFGGACNRWYNLRHKRKKQAEDRNLAEDHERLVFRKYVPPPGETGMPGNAPSVGINKSFMVNTYFPFYHHFFSTLGFRVLLPRSLDPGGTAYKDAPFCYPAEIAHGYFLDLLEKKPDYLFLPLFKGDYVKNSSGKGYVCPLSQGEPFYLATAFRDHDTLRTLKKKRKILTPVIDFSGGFGKAEKAFIEMARKMGAARREARRAFGEAVRLQEEVLREMEEKGRSVLAEIEEEAFAVVLFGRCYNAFVSEANMGLPGKFASRNIRVIPYHYLPVDGDIPKERMYWSAGQRILRCAKYVSEHPRLYGCYITNFSCGPDSFLIGYFRDLMGKKPSLTLELDSHVADAGLETRVEAFIDIVRRYREVEKGQKKDAVSRPFAPAVMRLDGDKPLYIDSRGREVPLHDPGVHLVFPSMGRFVSEAGSAIFRSAGIRASTLPPADENTLRLGMGHASCKECLPLLITVGSLLKYLDERKVRDEKLLYFMPTASGPCRFGQYSVFLNDLIAKMRLKDVALFSSSGDKGYADMTGLNLMENLWSGVVLSDIFEEMQSVILTNGNDREETHRIFEDQWGELLHLLEKNPGFREKAVFLRSAADALGRIKTRRSLRETPVVLLTGEIYVRHDDISRQYLVEDLAGKGFATRVSTVAEWIYYTKWCVRNGVVNERCTLREKLSLFLTSLFMKKQERAFRKILSASGLCSGKTENVDHVIRHARHLMNPQLGGEAILTIGASINEILDHCCGVIAIGPFGCMPNRLAEAVLAREMTLDGKLAAGNRRSGARAFSGNVWDLPFLAVESDGNPFPQMIEARIEAFLLQAEKIHERMRSRSIPS